MINNITNISEASILISRSSSEIWTIIFGIVALGVFLFGGHILFCLKERKEILQIIKSFKGNWFIKNLKEKLSINYLIGAKFIMVFIVLSLIFYIMLIYKVYVIANKNGTYTIDQLVNNIILTLAFSLIAGFIAYLLKSQKEKLKRYGEVEEVGKIPDIPSSLIKDIKEIETLFNKSKLTNNEMKDRIIESVAQVINTEDNTAKE